jgi:hypothetical protein
MLQDLSLFKDELAECGKHPQYSNALHPMSTKCLPKPRMKNSRTRRDMFLSPHLSGMNGSLEPLFSPKRRSFLWSVRSVRFTASSPTKPTNLSVVRANTLSIDSAAVRTSSKLLCRLVLRCMHAPSGIAYPRSLPVLYKRLIPESLRDHPTQPSSRGFRSFNRSRLYNVLQAVWKLCLS